MSLCHTFSFVKPISLQLYDVNLWYFKLTLFNITEFIVWSIKSLRHWVALILKLENQSLRQKLNSFVRKTKTRGATSSQLLHQFYLFPLIHSMVCLKWDICWDLQVLLLQFFLHWNWIFTNSIWSLYRIFFKSLKNPYFWSSWNLYLGTGRNFKRKLMKYLRQAGFKYIRS